MSKPLFGKILDPAAKSTRDAVHIPIVPVIAADVLTGGDRILLSNVNGTVTAVEAGFDDYSYAIVDPFIRELIPAGSLFYAWLRPESTHKLWHEWTHRELDKNT